MMFLKKNLKLMMWSIYVNRLCMVYIRDVVSVLYLAKQTIYSVLLLKIDYRTEVQILIMIKFSLSILKWVNSESF